MAWWAWERVAKRIVASSYNIANKFLVLSFLMVITLKSSNQFTDQIHYESKSLFNIDKFVSHFQKCQVEIWIGFVMNLACKISNFTG